MDHEDDTQQKCIKPRMYCLQEGIRFGPVVSVSCRKVRANVERTEGCSKIKWISSQQANLPLVAKEGAPALACLAFQQLQVRSYERAKP